MTCDLKGEAGLARTGGRESQIEGHRKRKGPGVLDMARVPQSLTSRELQSLSHKNLAWSILQKCIKHLLSAL